MTVEFVLEGKGFSVNRAYYASRKVLTSEAREWIEQINSQLEEVKDLVDIAAAHRGAGGTFHMDICHYYPARIFFNKQGQISSKSGDVDNLCKLLIDAVFRKMDVNDKYITSLYSAKRVGSRHYIEIKIRLL